MLMSALSYCLAIKGTTALTCYLPTPSNQVSSTAMCAGLSDISISADSQGPVLQQE